MKLQQELLIISLLLITLSHSSHSYTGSLQTCHKTHCKSTAHLNPANCTLSNFESLPVNSSHPQLKKFFAQMNHRPIKTPHCFLHPSNDTAKMYKVSCICEAQIGEACSTVRARAEALYQWRRDVESRVTGGRNGKVTRNIRKVECALEAFAKVSTPNYHLNYTVDISNCGSPPNIINSSSTFKNRRFSIHFDDKIATIGVDMLEKNIHVKNLDEIYDVTMPLRIMRLQKGMTRRYREKKFEEHAHGAQCILNSFRRLVESKVVGTGKKKTVAMIGARRIKLRVASEQDLSLNGTSAICWLLMLIFAIPMTALAVAAVVLRNEEPRLELPETSTLPDVEDVLSETYPPEPILSPSSSAVKSKDSEHVDIAISMQCDPNHTDLGSEATGEGVVALKNVSPEPVTPKEDQIL